MNFPEIIVFGCPFLSLTVRVGGVDLSLLLFWCVIISVIVVFSWFTVRLLQLRNFVTLSRCSISFIWFLSLEFEEYTIVASSAKHGVSPQSVQLNTKEFFMVVVGDVVAIYGIFYYVWQFVNVQRVH